MNKQQDIPQLEAMTAPNKLLIMDCPLEQKHLPMLASTKYNGVRATLIGADFYSRSGRTWSLPSSLRPELQPLIKWALHHRLVLDGEFNSNSYNTVGETMSIMAGTMPMPEDFKFKVFYVLPEKVWKNPYFATMDNLIAPNNFLPPTARSEAVKQTVITTVEQFEAMVEGSRYSGIEGLMLLKPDSHYKHGKATLKEGRLLKYKYYGDKEDAQVISLTYRQERVSGDNTKVSPLGKAEQSHRKNDFDDTDIGGALLCKMENGDIIKAPFPLDYPLQARRRAAQLFGTGQPGDLKGSWICFQRLQCENKDKPIAIKGVEFRDAK